MIYRKILFITLYASLFTSWTVCVGLPPSQTNSDLINTGTTRAAFLWRKMIDHDPLLASEASMFWRMASVNDAKGASLEALNARKITAQNPEEMAQKALLFRNKRSSKALYENLTHEYWRKFAANDPEVAARSAMYWIQNPDANMYW